MKAKIFLFFGLIFNLTGSGFSQNQIIIGDTTNMNYTVVSGPQGTPFEMDIDNNGSKDFILKRNYYPGLHGPTNLVSIRPLGFNKEKCARLSSPYLPTPLDSLEILDSNGIWNNGGTDNSYWLIASFYNEAYTYIEIGLWPSKTKYLGIQLSDGVDTLWGWIKIKVGPFGSTFGNVIEYACQKGNLNYIDEIKKESFKIFPNPANENITIETTDITKQQTISIYNIQGQLLLQQPMHHTTTEIDISHLAKGVYIIKLSTAEGVAVKKFIKE